MKNTQTASRFMKILLGVTAMLITVTGIAFRQSFINILPLYISLFVSLMQSRVNRIAYLIGAANSILYAIVYIHFKLYASAVYAVLFSCFLQLATYFLWSSRSFGKATVFRAMKGWQRAILATGFVVAWTIVWFILPATDSVHRIFDISSSLLGMLNTVLTMLAFIEYVPLMILGQFVNIGLYISMLRDNPAQITYLIYALFSLSCQILALKKVLFLYRQQNAQKIRNTIKNKKEDI